MGEAQEPQLRLTKHLAAEVSKLAGGSVSFSLRGLTSCFSVCVDFSATCICLTPIRNVVSSNIGVINISRHTHILKMNSHATHAALNLQVMNESFHLHLIYTRSRTCFMLK